jgi:H+/Cl- antiporter ClcA
MCAYLTGVTQAPLTSAVISLELTDSGDLLLPILATVLIARGVSGLVCRVPIYRGLAELLMVPRAPDVAGGTDPGART